MLSEMRLFVLGECESGKSLLVERLVAKGAVPPSRQEQGLRITPWAITLAGQARSVTIWDFGKREILQQTYRLFLAPQNLSLLVLDARRDAALNREEDWLERLYQLDKNASVMIVIQQGADQSPYPFREQALRERFTNICGVFRVSLDTDEGIEDLRAAIQVQLGALLAAQPEVPQAFLKVREVLQQDTRPYLTDTDFTRLCLSVGIDSDAQQHQLAHFLHTQGDTLHFEEAELYRTHVLSPAWLLEGVGTLLERSQAVLELPQLASYLDSTRYPQERHRFFVALIEKFQLCFRLEGTHPESFLLPSRLPQSEPELGSWSGALRFEYHYAKLPPNSFTRLLVQAHRLVDKTLWWQRGVVLVRGESRALVRLDEEKREVKLWITGPEAGRRQLLATLREYLQSVHQGIPNLGVEELIYVSDDEQIARRPLLLEDLKRLHDSGETEYIAAGVGRLSLEDLLLRYGAPTEVQAEPIAESTVLPELSDEERKAQARLRALEQEKRIEEHNRRVWDQEKKAGVIKVVLEQQAERYASRWVRFVLLYPLLLLVGMLVAVFALGWRTTAPTERGNFSGVVHTGWTSMEPWTWLIPLLGGVLALAYYSWSRKNPSQDPLRKRLYETRRRKLLEKNGIIP